MRRILWILLLCLTLSGCFGRAVPRESGVVPTDSMDHVTHGGEKYHLREDLTTILVLGLDSFEYTVDEMAYTNHHQADFQLLLVMDEDDRVCTPLHINRDTMTEVRRLGVGGGSAGDFVAQIALAHTYGSGGSDSSLNACRAVSELLGGIRVDHYITMTMDAVSVINDQLGGVTVMVTEDFSRVDPTLRQGETLTLTGEQALNYVRIRHSMDDSSNLSRMKRQQQYMEAFQTQLLERHSLDSSFLTSVMLELDGDFASDCSAGSLLELMTILGECEMEPIRELEGEAKRGVEFMEFYPDRQSLQETILDLFYEKDA